MQNFNNIGNFSQHLKFDARLNTTIDCPAQVALILNIMMFPHFFFQEVTTAAFTNPLSELVYIQKKMVYKNIAKPNVGLPTAMFL